VFCLTGPAGDDARAGLSPGATLVWTVQAASHFLAMTLYYRHQGWGEYTTDQDWDFKTYEELGWETDEMPTRRADSQAVELTRSLRTSDVPLFVRLRELLHDRRVDVGTAVLAQLFPDDVDQEFGVLVSDGRVFTFVMHYARRGDLSEQLRNAAIHEWTDITDHWESSPYRRYVRGAPDLPADWDR
jgi:hypothetical protein